MHFFQRKVADIRVSTEDELLLTFVPPPGFQLNDFADIIVDDVIKLICCAPSKQPSLDPLPTWLLKECAEIISPFIASLCNASMKNGQVQKTLKEAYITPLLKKPTLDSNYINNYRPISNLSVLSKLLEKAVCKQLVSNLDANNLIPRNQSAYRRNHSTESALTKVFSIIMSAIDNGNLVLLSLLDLSAAFDCVDYEIVLNCLGHSFGVQSKFLKWLTSYLTGQTQCVHLSEKISFVESYVTHPPDR